MHALKEALEEEQDTLLHFYYKCCNVSVPRYCIWHGHVTTFEALEEEQDTFYYIFFYS